MVQNIKSVLIGLTKDFGPDEVSSALGYGPRWRSRRELMPPSKPSP